MSRAALTHRHISLKGLFLDCVAEREKEARDLRSANQVALQEQFDDLQQKNRRLQTRATHWEGAAGDLARTLAALHELNATARARLDAVIADVARDDIGREAVRNVSAMSGRRRK